ncbi:MAG TPA: type II toxin-antitoxin system RelE/ParE family toxin [Candidatus Dormibacteraeota bacterium]|jgi:mRNA-degrading endonuclease RelE of RelBE toxin-antitoxin system|nr:type II toxin-antitoxin system RelE/ParE family toxin [Candidatus Dormibacteraeota bacterium]
MKTLISDTAAADLTKVPAQKRGDVVQVIDKLSSGGETISVPIQPGLRMARVGDYRVVFSVDHPKDTIQVLSVFEHDKQQSGVA